MASFSFVELHSTPKNERQSVRLRKSVISHALNHLRQQVAIPTEPSLALNLLVDPVVSDGFSLLTGFVLSVLQTEVAK